MLPKATAKVNGVVIAESDQYTTVEGNIYFPPNSVKADYLKKSDTSTYCPWKGDAAYYDINVNGTIIKDAAWFYPDPKEKFSEYRDYVAFYKSKLTIDTIAE